MQPKQWQDLTDRQKRGIVILGALQLALLAASLIDIRRRPAKDINGSKRLWTMVVFINGIGPIAYYSGGSGRHQQELPSEGDAAILYPYHQSIRTCQQRMNTYVAGARRS
jgi:hypothetical protein